MRRAVWVSTEVDVEVSIDDIVDSLDEQGKKDLASRLLGSPKSAPVGLGEGDRPLERVVEQAYLAARRVPKLPREIADLFWHVHGRAIA
ncbi:MAG TPA: hypothetical protein VEY92_01195 [Pseudoxanthomonas sp.]|nr:hypothetical protein [Pseudoxanthomonas sp.]